MIDGEVLRVALHYAMKGASDVMNVFHFVYEGTGDTDSSVLTNIEDWLTDVWGVDWALLASDDADMTFADVDIVNTLGEVVRNLGVATAAVVGGNNTDESAVAAAYFMMADTGFPKNRGKKYVPGLTEVALVDGLLSITYLAKLVVLLSTWMTTETSPSNGELVPGIMSLTKAAFLAFTGSGYATDVPAYQRRRKPNVGA